MSEMTGLFLKQFAILRAKLQSCSTQTVENSLQINQVLFKKFSSLNYVIQIDHTNFGEQTAQYSLQKFSECGRSIAQSKGHNFEMPPPTSCAKASVLFIFWMYAHLPEAAPVVEDRKPLNI